MSPFRTAPLLLAAALAACSSDSTGPSAPRETASAPELASASAPAASYSRKFPFTQTSAHRARAAVTNTNMAHRAGSCVDSGIGWYTAELTIPTTSLMLALAKSGTVEWSTQQSYFHRGLTATNENATLTLDGAPIYGDNHGAAHYDPGTILHVQRYSHTLTPSQLAQLRKGGTLRVQLAMQATVTLPFCWITVRGGQAKTGIYMQPYLVLTA